MSEERRQIILETITAELRAAGGKIDPMALATAIDAALGADTLEAGHRSANIKGTPSAGSSPKGAYATASEGRTPDELNASNDDGRG